LWFVAGCGTDCPVTIESAVVVVTRNPIGPAGPNYLA
jgi:hypothetical protein